MSLYTTTKQLINLIKQVKPEFNEYKMGSTKCWYSHPEYAKNGPYPISYLAMRGGQKRECEYITTDVLIDLIPQLFAMVANPEFLTISELRQVPGDLCTALIRRYFDYYEDNGPKNWWQRDQEGVLLDLIEEIKKVYKK